MPKLIPSGTYTANVPDVGSAGVRRASAEDFGGGVGRALQGLGNVAQDIANRQLDYADQQDQRHVLVENAKIRQRYAKELEDAEQSGADVDKIRERLEADVSRISDNLNTKHGLQSADQHGANTLNVFDTTVNSIRVRRASAEAKTAAANFLSANGALLTTNPSYLPISENEVGEFVETFKGRLPPEQLAEMSRALKQQMNVTAVAALVRLTPDAVKKQLEEGKFDLSPEQRMQEIGRADMQIRAIRAEKAAERADAEYERRHTSDSARDEWFREIMSNTPGSLPKIISDIRLTPEHREHMVVFHENWLKSKFKVEKNSDPSVVRDLMLDVHAPEGSPRKIYTDDKLYEALKLGYVNTTDFRMLKAEVANSRDPNNNTVNQRYNEAMRFIGDALSKDPVLTAQTYLQSTAVLSWAADVRTRMDEERKQGHNPAFLFDPTDKASVVRPEFVAKYVNMARMQAREGVAKSAQEAVNAVTIGDNPEEYKALKPGAVFVGPDGQLRTKPRDAVFGGVTVPPIAHRNQSLESRIRGQYRRQRGESSDDYDARIKALTDRAVAAGAL